jgi:hypothetical protein
LNREWPGSAVGASAGRRQQGWDRDRCWREALAWTFAAASTRQDMLRLTSDDLPALAADYYYNGTCLEMAG